MSQANQAKGRIDCRAEIVAPVNYSFMEVGRLEDIFEQEMDPRPIANSKKGYKKDHAGRLISNGLLLNNNGLDSIAGLSKFCFNLIASPSQITWLDLSYNSLAEIDDVLLGFDNLKMLYLHANRITDLQSVQKLSALKNLKKLTLHGNPIEREKGYYYYVLGVVPTLRTLDFTGVTKAERKSAETWQKMVFATRNRKHSDDEDD